MSTSGPWPQTYQEGVMLKSGECLPTNQYLHSYNGGFFAIMQSDGNFVVYKGTCPEDNRGFLWHTGRTGPIGEYFAIMQADGNFCIYHGNPLNQGALLWDIRRTAAGGQFLAVLRYDGVLAVFKGEAADFGLPAELIWDSQTHGTPGLNIIRDQTTGDAQESSGGHGDQSLWQSFTPSRTGGLPRVDVAVCFGRAGNRYEQKLEVREGVGTSGRVLATKMFWVDSCEGDTRERLPWRTIELDRSVPLEAGSKYTLHFTTNHGPLFFTTGNAYPGGSSSFPGFNLMFRTYRMPPWMPYWPYPPIE